MLAFDTWQRSLPHSGDLGPLIGIAAHSAGTEEKAELASGEAIERFPAGLIVGLRALGQLRFGCDRDAPYTTAYHLNTLNAYMNTQAAIAARRSGSLPIYLVLAGLALMAATIARTGDKLGLVREQTLTGADATGLLSEWSHGSDLLATETRAERGCIGTDADGGGFAPVAEGEVSWLALAMVIAERMLDSRAALTEDRVKRCVGAASYALAVEEERVAKLVRDAIRDRE